MDFAKMLMAELSKFESSDSVQGFIRLIKGHMPKDVLPKMEICNNGDLLISKFFSKNAIHDVRLVGGKIPSLSHTVTDIQTKNAKKLGLSLNAFMEKSVEDELQLIQI